MMLLVHRFPIGQRGVVDKPAAPECPVNLIRLLIIRIDSIFICFQDHLYHRQSLVLNVFTLKDDIAKAISFCISISVLSCN